MRKVFACFIIILITASTSCSSASVFLRGGGGGKRYNLSRIAEIRQFLGTASLQDVKNAVTSGGLNPRRMFGEESILDTAITNIPNTSPEKAAIIEYFIGCGADVNHQGKIISVLCRAVLVCRPDVVEVLLDAGASNTFNARGLSLSNIARSNRNLRGSSVLTRITSLQ